MKIRLASEDGLAISSAKIISENGEINLPVLPNTADAVAKLVLPKPAIKLLPPAVRWISADRRLVVFERPPMKQLIQYIPQRKDEITAESESHLKSYEVPIPWTVYLVSMNSDYLPVHIKVFARNSSLTALNDTLGILPLLNFYYDGSLCPPTFGVFEGNPTCMADGIGIAYNMVWNSGWNFDLEDAIKLANNHGKPFQVQHFSNNGSFLARWFQTWSQYDISGVLQLPWATPSNSKANSSSPTGLLTLDNAIKFSRQHLMAEEPDYGRTFLVRLAGSLM